MSLKRNRLWLFAGALALLMGGPALSEDLQDADLGAPVDMDQFGGGPRPHEGLFLNFQGLFWTLSAPRITPFGAAVTPGTGVPVWWGLTSANNPTESSTTQQTTLDTGFLKSDWTGGQRIEFGNIWQHDGWRIGYLNLARSTQQDIESNVQVLLNDQPWGAAPQFLHLDGYTGNQSVPNAAPGTLLPTGADPTTIQRLGVEFAQVSLINRIKVWGVDASYLRRTHPMPGGGLFEWSLGARFMEIKEDFSVEAIGGLLGDTTLWCAANNELVGPHIGLRWFRTNDRWTLSLSGDFTGAANMQTVRQLGLVGSELNTVTDTAEASITAPITQPVLPRSGPTTITPPYPRFTSVQPLVMPPMDVNHSANMQVFSPIAEVRVEAEYQLTQTIAVRGGWSGIFIGNLARPSGMIDYTLGETQTLGILTHNNRQNLFMNGLDLGLTVNY